VTERIQRELLGCSIELNSGAIYIIINEYALLIWNTAGRAEAPNY
jgi:hypothetical protein